MSKDSFLTRHLHDAGETYFQHLAFTIGFAARMIGGGIAIFIHGLMPFLFTYTGSGVIEKLHAEMQTRRALRKNNKN